MERLAEEKRRQEEMAERAQSGYTKRKLEEATGTGSEKKQNSEDVDVKHKMAYSNIYICICTSILIIYVHCYYNLDLCSYKVFIKCCLFDSRRTLYYWINS